MCSRSRGDCAGVVTFSVSGLGSHESALLVPSNTNYGSLGLFRESEVGSDSKSVVETERAPSIAVCYVGHLRSFASNHHVRENHLENFLRPLQSISFNLDLYFAVGKGNCLRSRRCWEDKNILNKIQGIKSWLQSKGQNVTAVEIDPDTNLYPESFIRKQFADHNCSGELGWPGVSTVSMWNRVKRCYNLVEKEEKRMNRNYSGMIRIRPDLFFVEKINPLDIIEVIKTVHKTFDFDTSQFAPSPYLDKQVKIEQKEEFESIDKTPNSVLVPKHYWVKNGGFNDWASFCPRDKCYGDFNVFEDWLECRQYDANQIVKLVEEEIEYDKSAAQSRLRAETTQRRPCCMGIGHPDALRMVFGGHDIHHVASSRTFPVSIAREMRRNLMSSFGDSDAQVHLECKRIHASQFLHDCQQINSALFT
eukprot:CAMPEP_0114515778 /NCGR_PEP_ID=MMETSP0109-20121206/16947_1 /TAXON_ID=29199 /ORGANISM="Chlorarachnion reptans, Strain CCCM449" /LENGTH=419 /DNA_ID=CAMNT_0001696065 /DNA_START=190 /DNA_END=1450 /DNA_ORIENTATION=-